MSNQEFDVASNVVTAQRRRILSMVETLNSIDPTVEVISYRDPAKTEWECIEWSRSSDKFRFTEPMLLAEQLKKTKELWIIILMEEANQIQQRALALHTIAQESPLHQKILYDQKYQEASDYVARVGVWLAENNKTPPDLPTPEQVTIPDIIYEEGSRTGDPFYYLCLAIMQNYMDSEATLKRFYGQVEGVRRVTKASIKNCANMHELESLQWAEWPKYVGNPPNPQD